MNAPKPRFSTQGPALRGLPNVTTSTQPQRVDFLTLNSVDSNIRKFSYNEHELYNKYFLVHLFDRCNGLFTLPDTDSDPDLGTDVHPRNGAVTIGDLDLDKNLSLNLYKGEAVSIQYNVAIRFGVRIWVDIMVYLHWKVKTDEHQCNTVLYICSEVFTLNLDQYRCKFPLVLDIFYQHRSRSRSASGSVNEP